MTNKIMPILLLATRNEHKVGELRALLAGAGAVEIKSARDFPGIPEPDETGETFLENAEQKARYYCENTGLAALADDSGLVVDALGGRPGVYSSRYGSSDADRIARLLKEMENVSEPERSARFVCSMAFAQPDSELKWTEGKLEGAIGAKAQGEFGFGYDPIFRLPAMDCTLAQVAPETKNAISHRGRALQQMLPILEAYFRGDQKG